MVSIRRCNSPQPDTLCRGWSAERMEVQALLWGLLTRGAKLASMTIDLHGSLEHKPRAPPL